MSYIRVIPRDFFNESKLLKCMGRVTILSEVTPEIDIEVEERNEPFDIQLNELWGKLEVVNYPVTVNGERIKMGTEYNSKDNYPLILMYGNEEVRVLDEAGDFTEDFINTFK